MPAGRICNHSRGPNPWGGVLLAVLGFINSADAAGVTAQIPRHLQAPQTKDGRTTVNSFLSSEPLGDSTYGYLASLGEGAIFHRYQGGLKEPHRIIFYSESL